MNVTYEKKDAMTFIGYHTEIRPEEGYQKCPEFWDKEYAAKYARLWQTMMRRMLWKKRFWKMGLVCLQSVQILKMHLRTGSQACTRAEKFRKDWSYILSRQVSGLFLQPEGLCLILFRR
jgi:hypothetical protein